MAGKHGRRLHTRKYKLCYLKSDHEERECRGRLALCRGLGCPQIIPFDIKREEAEQGGKGHGLLRSDNYRAWIGSL